MHRAILVVLFAAAASAQNPADNHPKKALIPQQFRNQQATKDYKVDLDKLRAATTDAYSAEFAREKASECPAATTTYDINMCLSREIDLTDANYKAFTTSLRDMLALPSPAMPGTLTPSVGPTGPEGTPATNTAAFDAAESAWQTYAKAECSAMDTLWRGGTIVNSIVGKCELRLAHVRMHELDLAYSSLLHPH